MQTEAVTGDEKAGTAVEQQKKRRSAEAMQQVFGNQGGHSIENRSIKIFFKIDSEVEAGPAVPDKKAISPERHKLPKNNNI